MTKGFFVTGTDTDIGKTIMSGALVRVLFRLGKKPCAIKPVETGCTREGDILIPSDGSYLKHTARMDEPINKLTSYCFESPVSPMTAGEREGIEIDRYEIAGLYAGLRHKYDTFVVEGLGGLLVPLTKEYYILDMARDFALPLVVVARPSIGTINHTLLTVRCALGAGLRVAGVIINYSRPPDGTLPEETVLHALKSVLTVPVLGVMPYLSDLSNQSLENVAMSNLDVKELEKYL